MMRSKEDLVWIPTFATLIVFSVPWFLWGNDAIVAGLPVWLWWHVGWMVLCAVAFHRFARGAWDRWMGLADGGARNGDSDGGITDGVGGGDGR